MRVWLFRVGVLGLVLSQGAGASARNPRVCRDYFGLFGAQEKLVEALHRLGSPLSEQEHAFWTEEIRSYRAEIARLKNELFSEPTAKIPSLGTTYLEPIHSLSIEPFETVRPENDEVAPREIRLSMDATKMAVLAEDGSTVFFWDLTRLVYWSLKSPSKFRQISFDWDGNLITLDSSGGLQHHAIVDGALMTSRLGSNKVDAMAFSPMHFVVIENGIHFSLPRHYNAGHTLPGPPLKHADFFALSEDERLIAFVGEQALHLVDANTGARFKTFPEYGPGQVLAMQFEPGGSRLALITREGEIAIWSPGSPKQIARYGLADFDAQSLVWDCMGNLYIAGSTLGALEGMVVVLDVHNGEEAARLHIQQTGGAGSITLSADEGTLILGNSSHGEVHFYKNPFGS